MEHVILIVEDDVETQMFLEVTLVSLYQVRLAPDAETAWRMLDADAVDLMLIDLSLGPGKNGLELAEQIRADDRYRKLPLIAVTAHAFPTDRERCFAAGFSEYIAKPFAIQELRDMIESQLWSSRV